MNINETLDAPEATTLNCGKNFCSCNLSIFLKVVPESGVKSKPTMSDNSCQCRPFKPGLHITSINSKCSYVMMFIIMCGCKQLKKLVKVREPTLNSVIWLSTLRIIGSTVGFGVLNSSIFSNISASTELFLRPLFVFFIFSAFLNSSSANHFS